MGNIQAGPKSRPFFYVQDVRYFATEHMDVRREAL